MLLVLQRTVLITVSRTFMFDIFGIILTIFLQFSSVYSYNSFSFRN